MNTATEEEPEQELHTAKVDQNGIKLVGLILIWAAMNLIILLAVAGDPKWPYAWTMTCFTLTFQLSALTILAKVNPTLLNERGKMVKEDTKNLDKWFHRIYKWIIIGVLVIAALDSGRYGWSSVPLWITVAAYVMAVPIYVWTFWAMLTNTHFESTVRIQHDRNHQVISSGPYAFVRHPGYVGALIVMTLFPLLLGSLWAYTVVVLAMILMLVRTALEDKMLHAELNGYADYAQKVKYRIVPGIW